MATISENLVLRDNFSAAFTNFIRLAEQASSAVIDMRGSLNNIETTTARAALATEQLAQRMSQTSRQADNTGNSISGLMGKVKGLVASYVGLQTVGGLVNLSDTFTQTTARLDLMNDGLQTTQELTQMIYQSAQNSRGAFDATAAMVSKLGTLAGNAFNSSQEIIAFVEQLNKQMALSGTSVQEGQAAMLQLTQAMASGVLRGEELNSVMEQTPMIAQTIAGYLGVNTGKLREMASEGLVTAEIVKNAMFDAAKETNAAFNDMPMTWAQVWQSFKNTATMAMQPVLNGISWLANNMDDLAPIIAGVAGAVGFLAIALGVYKTVTWLAVDANRAFIASLLTNPLAWIAVVIGVIVAKIYEWAQSVGGIRIAWMIMVNNVLTWWGHFKESFFTGVYAVMNFCDAMGLKFAEAGTAVSNAVIDMRANVLMNVQDMVNGAIGMINWFITQLNKIPGVSIQAIEEVTFGANAQAEAEALKNANNQNLAALAAENQQKQAERAANLANLIAQNRAEEQSRLAEIAKAQAEVAEMGKGVSVPMAELPSDLLGDISKNTGKTAGNTSALKDAVDMTDEDLKMLVDMAERQYVAQVNLTSQAPVINITGQNTGNTAEDRAAMADAIKRVLLEQRASGTYRAYARV